MPFVEIGDVDQSFDVQIGKLLVQNCGLCCTYHLFIKNVPDLIGVSRHVYIRGECSTSLSLFERRRDLKITIFNCFLLGSASAAHGIQQCSDLKPKRFVHIKTIYERFGVLVCAILLYYLNPDLVEYQPPNYKLDELRLVEGIMACYYIFKRQALWVELQKDKRYGVQQKSCPVIQHSS